MTIARFLVAMAGFLVSLLRLVPSYPFMRVAIAGFLVSVHAAGLRWILRLLVSFCVALFPFSFMWIYVAGGIGLLVSDASGVQLSVGDFARHQQMVGQNVMLEAASDMWTGQWMHASCKHWS